MRATKMNKTISMFRLAPLAMLALTLLFTATAHATAPGITGTSFSLQAKDASISQPDGQAVYSWGYGCAAGYVPSFLPLNISTTATCSSMQIPGPTLIVTEGQTITVTLTNSLPPSAGNTSILFPGFHVATSGGVAGLLTQEAAPSGTVTYMLTAFTPGTHSYYSGTQGDLQVEMGLYGAIIVLPSAPPANCDGGLAASNLLAQGVWGELDYRLAHAAYDNPKTCYDREYLFQFAEMDANIHRAALAQVTAKVNCVAGAPGC